VFPAAFTQQPQEGNTPEVPAAIQEARRTVKDTPPVVAAEVVEGKEDLSTTVGRTQYKKGQRCKALGKDCQSCFKAGCFWQLDAAFGTAQCHRRCTNRNAACFGTFDNVPEPHNVLQCPTPQEDRRSMSAPVALGKRNPDREKKANLDMWRDYSQSKPDGSLKQYPTSLHAHANADNLTPVACLRPMPIVCQNTRLPAKVTEFPAELGWENATHYCIYVPDYYCLETNPEKYSWQKQWMKRAGWADYVQKINQAADQE
jgi:hypothetical protein